MRHFTRVSRTRCEGALSGGIAAQLEPIDNLPGEEAVVDDADAERSQPVGVGVGSPRTGSSSAGRSVFVDHVGAGHAPGPRLR
jgi:hypothetical protein